MSISYIDNVELTLQPVQIVAYESWLWDMLEYVDVYYRIFDRKVNLSKKKAFKSTDERIQSAVASIIGESNIIGCLLLIMHTSKLILHFPCYRKNSS
jgi:hypothetical protein